MSWRFHFPIRKYDFKGVTLEKIIVMVLGYLYNIFFGCIVSNTCRPLLQSSDNITLIDSFVCICIHYLL